MNKSKQYVIPKFILEAVLVQGAKKSKLGNQAKAGLMVLSDVILQFDNKDLSPEELYEKEEHRLYRAVKIGTSKVMRMRPIFPEWSLIVNVHFLDELLNEKDVFKMAEDAGIQCGIGDWRPQHGRFRVKKV